MQRISGFLFSAVGAEFSFIFRAALRTNPARFNFRFLLTAICAEFSGVLFAAFRACPGAFRRLGFRFLLAAVGTEFPRILLSALGTSPTFGCGSGNRLLCLLLTDVKEISGSCAAAETFRHH